MEGIVIVLRNERFPVEFLDACYVFITEWHRQISATVPTARAAKFLRRRDVKFDPATSRDNVFRCEGCEYVYTDDGDVERSLCPECGAMNSSVQF